MDTFVQEYPATAAAVPAARADVGRHFHGNPAYDDAYLLASELAQNAVRHGTGARFIVAIDHGDTGVTVTFTNTGRGVFPQAIDTSFADVESENGRGLSLMAALAPAYGIDVVGDQTTIWFSFPHAAAFLAAA